MSNHDKIFKHSERQPKEDILLDSIASGNHQKVREIFDQAFWNNESVSVGWEHLKIALEREDKLMMRLLISRNARPTEEDLMLLTPEKTALLRKCGLRMSPAVVEGDAKTNLAVPEITGDAAIKFKIGEKMKDGTIYAGISPDTGRAMYAMPADESLTITFNQAKERAEDLTKESGKYYRVPSASELNVLYNNRDAIGGFKSTGSYPDYLYWSSTPHGNQGSIAVQRFSDGRKDHFKTIKMSARLIRT